MNELMITSGNSVDKTMISSSNSVDQSGPYSSPTLLEERSNQQSTSDKENEVSCESPYASGNSVSIEDSKMALVTVEDIFSKEFNIEFPPDIADSVHLESIPSFGSDEISLEDFMN